ncbi:MAG: GntR family transcriptional regulator [Treponema sp.]|nr:GntR family transcriptional regulator [Treponema sp.]
MKTEKIFIETAATVLVKKTLSEQIYEVLREDIINGNINLGDRLTNRELQERFQVSSTPVRDAVNILFHDGLVRTVTRSGAQLIDFTVQYATEVNEFISALSCEALSLSVKNSSPTDVVNDLYKWQSLMETAAEDTYYDYDYQYHKTFFRYSMNHFLQDAFKRVNLVRSFLFRYAIRTTADKQISVAQHTGITDAYAAGNYQAARERLEEYFNYGLQCAIHYYSQ